MGESRMSVKLMTDTHGKRVLFAEAGKDFVDFLFHILSMPVGSIMSLVSGQEMVLGVGSLQNLNQSKENMNESYLQSNLATPKPVLPQHAEKVLYWCTECEACFSDDPRAICPDCKLTMSEHSDMTYVAPLPPAPPAAGGGEGGYVKEAVTYMVMDDLVVMPMSNISAIALLNKLNVKNISDLEEKLVFFNKNDEVGKLLMACLQSKKVLSDVFLKE